jgi:TRAP-type C4-dicarboxylate transport system permease small subunit
MSSGNNADNTAGVNIKSNQINAEKIITVFCQVASMIGVVFLVAIVSLTVVDVLLRVFFNSPILGSTEITEYMMICLILGTGLCALRGRQIKMDMIVDRFKPRAQAYVDSFTNLLTLGIFGILCWTIFQEGLTLQKLKLISSILKIPTFPFYLVLSIGLGILCLALVVLVVKSIMKAVRK